MASIDRKDVGQLREELKKYFELIENEILEHSAPEQIIELYTSIDVANRPMLITVGSQPILTEI